MTDAGKYKLPKVKKDDRCEKCSTCEEQITDHMKQILWTFTEII